MSKPPIPAGISLPEPGYPISDRSITEWFRRQYGRDPSTEEVGHIMIAMTARDTTPPVQAPPLAETGWTAIEPEADPGQERQRTR